MAIVIGNISQFLTRYLSIDISAAHNWHAYIKLSKNSLEQIKFWEMNLLKINKRFLDKDATCTKIVYSDASGTGYSGYEVNTINGIA